MVLLTSNPQSKAFCAGGDIKGLLALKDNGASLKVLEDFFRAEY